MLVSIVASVRNEQQHIGQLLESIASQDYDEAIEIIICDDHSTDNTVTIAQSFTSQFDSFLVFANPEQGNTVGLNHAIKRSSGEYIVLASGHCWFEPDYISRCVSILKSTSYEIVGGRTVAHAQNSLAELVKTVQSTPFGVGSARFRYLKKPGFVPTVAFGVMKRELFNKVGLFDTFFIKNQDDEFSHRVLKLGGRVFCDPTAVIHYVVRTSLGGFIKQYFRYGFWKVGHLRKFAALPAVSQLVPALFVIAVLASLPILLCTRSLDLLILIVAGFYCFLSYGFSISSLLPRKLYLWLIVPFFYFLLHFTYGVGFLSGIASALFSGRISRIQPWTGETDEH